MTLSAEEKFPNRKPQTAEKQQRNTKLQDPNGERLLPWESLDGPAIGGLGFGV